MRTVYSYRITSTAMSRARDFCRALVRRKRINDDPGDTALKRCLTALDLTALGIGSTLGLGIYVLAGQVASEKAGPAVTLSFLVAAVASVFAGLCYAEFGARVPRAGSAYVYSYVTVGEFMAFIIGWNLILEYVIGTASVARGYSGYIDSLFNGTIGKHLREAMPIDLQDVSPYPDFLALSITLFLTVLLAAGVEESSRFNKIFTGINLFVVLFAVVAGSIKADTHNWKLDKSQVPNGTHYKVGEGGFLPFGFNGLMAGAATCFYGFIGFDCIATTGEEVKNPQKSIPISIILSLLIVFLAYFGVSAVQTLMVPYYLQNQSAPLPYVFDAVGWSWAGWVVRVGALAGLSTSLLGSMFPLPRVMYAMAKDGVIFRFFGNVHPQLKTPLAATIFAGQISGIMAMMFDVQSLADMMSIGTLLAYTLVAISVLILRYTTIDASPVMMSGQAITVTAPESQQSTNEKNPLTMSAVQDHSPSLVKQLFCADSRGAPTRYSARISRIVISCTSVLFLILNSVLAVSEHYSLSENPFIISAEVILGCFIISLIIILSKQPTEKTELPFKVPLVPIVPYLSVFVNLYLMCKLSSLTWIRFAIWMFLGLCMYFLYGMWNSTENKNFVDRRRIQRAAAARAREEQSQPHGFPYVNSGFILSEETPSGMSSEITLSESATHAS